MSRYSCVVILILFEGLLRHEPDQSHVSKVINLLLAICDALFRHKVIRRSYLSVNIVARHDNPLESPIAFGVRRCTPNLHISPTLFPIDAEQLALSTFVKIEEA